MVKVLYDVTLQQKAYLHYYVALHLNIMLIIITLIALDLTEQLKNLLNMNNYVIVMICV